MPDDPIGQLFAPPGAQRHLADQLAFNRGSRPEVARELGLAAIDLRRRVRRQDDPGASEPVLAAVAPAAGLAFQRCWPAREPAVGPDGLGPCGARTSAGRRDGVKGSASAADIGGSSSRFNRDAVVSRGSLPAPVRTPASSPDHVILGSLFGPGKGCPGKE